MQEKQKSLVPKIALASIVVLAIAGASFLGGIHYQKGKQPAVAAADSSSQLGVGDGSLRQRFSGERPVSGTVSAVSSSSLTITESDGTSKQYALTSSTTVTNSGQTASVSDIATGDTVLVLASSSNSSEATQVILNPNFQTFGNGPGGGSTNVQTN